MHKRVYCKFSLEGFHKWKEAPQNSSEDYLAFRHRHMFYFKCSAEVTDDDREIEFISMRRAIKLFLFNNYGLPCEFGEKSCEMIAQNGIDFMRSKYGDRAYLVDVSEDDENGSVVLSD